MPYVTFVPQAPMGESADPGIFVQGTHVPAPLVERSGIWIKTAGSAILLQQNYRLSTCDAPLWLVVDDGRLIFEHREMKVPLKKGETVFYRPYYPPKWSFLETAEIAPCRVNIVEGTYSCHERLEAYYDMKVFLTIDPVEQIQRIEKRNGSEKAVEFQKKWIPLEELYFEKCRTRSRCDVCFTMCDEM